MFGSGWIFNSSVHPYRQKIDDSGAHCTSQIRFYLILDFLHDANDSMRHGSKIASNTNLVASITKPLRVQMARFSYYTAIVLR